MNFVNCTPHAIRVVLEDSERVFEPSGIVARVSVKNERLDPLDSIPVGRASYGAVENLPAPEPNTVYIVSALVLQRVNRADVVAPDTGPTAIRENGQIVGVRGLVAA